MHFLYRLNRRLRQFIESSKEFCKSRDAVFLQTQLDQERRESASLRRENTRLGEGWSKDREKHQKAFAQLQEQYVSLEGEHRAEVSEVGRLNTSLGELREERDGPGGLLVRIETLKGELAAAKTQLGLVESNNQKLIAQVNGYHQSLAEDLTRAVVRLGLADRVSALLPKPEPKD